MAIENAENKYNFLYVIQGEKCAISREPIPQYMASKYNALLVDLHHRCHNVQWRREKYPNFIDSVLNLAIVLHEHHMTNPSALKITDYQANKIEKDLASSHYICKWANNPFILGSVEYTKQVIKEFYEDN